MGFHVPIAAEKAVQWREAAMEEVDEEAREHAAVLKEKRRLEWEKRYNQGRFSDANTPLTQELLLLRQGIVMLDSSDSRPGMSRCSARIAIGHSEDSGYLSHLPRGHASWLQGEDDAVRPFVPRRLLDLVGQQEQLLPHVPI